MYDCITYIRILTFFHLIMFNDTSKKMLVDVIAHEHQCKLSELNLVQNKKGSFHIIII